MKGFVRQSILRKAMALASLCVLSFSFTSVASEQVTINWWVVNWNFDTRAVIEELIIPTFESRNPNIKVEVRYITFM